MEDISKIGLEVITPSAKLVDIDKLIDGYAGTLTPCYYVMEHIGRVCYNSYSDDMTDEKVVSFLSHGAKKGHRSIFEFGQLHFSVLLLRNDFSRVYDKIITNKYIKVSYSREDDNEFLLHIKGSPRALIEILEDMVKDDTNISMTFFRSLWEALDDIVPEVLYNWETYTSIDNYADIAVQFDELNLKYRISDTTNVYNSNDPFTKYLFLVQCSRSETHEIVRHRPCSFMQSSQRYIRYGKKNPFIICVGTDQMETIDSTKESALNSFQSYMNKLENGERPENARVVLPNCCETKIFIYCDKEEYAHFDRMRTSKFAYPPVKEIFDSVHQQLIDKKYI
jgi:thymidylate synthase (FAD)